MASMYDNISTAADLLMEVKMHGLSMNTADICRAQDIFGHTEVKELIRLANDNGRLNGFNGEPDPRGTYSSGSDGMSKYFYQVAFSIWSWEDAVRFYNRHSNFPVIDALEDRQELKQRVNVLDEELNRVKTERDQEHKARLEATEAELAAQKKVDRLEAEAYALDMEIMTLKAKLYDLMVAKEVE